MINSEKKATIIALGVITIIFIIGVPIYNSQQEKTAINNELSDNYEEQEEIYIESGPIKPEIIEDEPEPPHRDEPESPEQKRRRERNSEQFDEIWNEVHRRGLCSRDGGMQMEGIYKNSEPLGKNIKIKYDDFFEKYTVSFYDENNNYRKLKVTDDNFKGQSKLWDFKIGRDAYSIKL
jgi:hypothetical protein